MPLRRTDKQSKRKPKKLYWGVYHFLSMKIHEGTEYGCTLKIPMDFPDDVKNLMHYLAKERNAPFQDAPNISVKGTQFKSGSWL